MANANWSNPTNSSLYTDVLGNLKDRDEDLAKQFDGTTSTNIPTNAIRWDSGANRWKKWNGTTWAELASSYDLTKITADATGTAAAPDYSWSGDPNTGIYRVAADQIGITTGGTLRFTITTAAFVGTLPWRGQDGDATNPAISFSGDTNTGLYRVGADQIGIATGGTLRTVIDASGNLGVGTASPSQKLDVAGNIKWSGATYENVYTITDGSSVDLNPSNGTVQLWTLGASRTPTASNFAAGQSMTLMIDDGSAYTITWPSVTWVNNAGAAPSLASSGYTVVALWKVSTTLYGALVGDGS